MSGLLDKSDLRQAGTAAKRVHDHKAKWTKGSRSINPDTNGVAAKLRPVKSHQ